MLAGELLLNGLIDQAPCARYRDAQHHDWMEEVGFPGIENICNAGKKGWGSDQTFMNPVF